MQLQYLPANNLDAADDWRPVYHFSPAAELPRIGVHWPQLADTKAKILDGWRFSDSPESDWYLYNVELRDPSQRDSTTGNYRHLQVRKAEQEQAEQYRLAISGERYYRMRHIGPLRIQTEAHLMELPAFDDPSICATTNDIILRRVGKAAAAIVSQYHRRHPIDPNLAIIRGFDSRQATWLAFCLNQPLYKSYLEQQVGTTSMVRVGLKHLAKMPVAECPKAFNELAGQYQQEYEAFVRAEEALFALRKTVQHWLDQRVEINDAQVQNAQRNRAQQPLAARFFKVSDIGDQLNYTAAEQSRQAHRLQEEAACLPLRDLAELNPRPQRADTHDQSTQAQVVKIKNLDGQLAITQSEEWADDSGWRVHKRCLLKFDVLISTFVESPKVAIVSRDLASETLASEQLAVLKFHRSPGAYALLMETPLITQQMSWLATGTVQRFIQVKMMANIVLPEIDRETANQWHHQLIELLETKDKASNAMDSLYQKMLQVYRRVLPDVSADNHSLNVPNSQSVERSGVKK